MMMPKTFGQRMRGKKSPMKGKKQKGPLRDVVEVLRLAEGLFDVDSVVFSCGHKGNRSAGAVRGRCSECGKEGVDAE
jgi:hypothetical protein